MAERYQVQRMKDKEGTFLYFVQDTWHGYCTVPTPTKRFAEQEARQWNEHPERCVGSRMDPDG